MYFRAGVKKTVGIEKIVSTVGNSVCSVLSYPKKFKLLRLVVTNSKAHK
jgi:hypothetical protein